MELTLDLNKRYTYADYLTWLDDKRRELVNGFIRMMSPAPALTHQRLLKRLFRTMDSCVNRRNGSCEAFIAPFDVRLPKCNATGDGKIYDVVQPDICVVCDPSKIDERGCLGAPDLVIEILSPSTRIYDQTEKKLLYETAGVREYWIVDGATSSITVYLQQPDGRYDTGTEYDSTTKTIPVRIFADTPLRFQPFFKH